MRVDYKENGIEIINVNEENIKASFKSLKEKGVKVFELNGTSSIHDKKGLLEEINKVCGFPGYFGFNWDALRDCLNDFSFNEGSGYLIIFWNYNTLKLKLEKKDLDILLDILKEACDTWKQKKVFFKAIMIS